MSRRKRSESHLESASYRRQGPHLQDRPSESGNRQRDCSDPQTAVVVNTRTVPADDPLAKTIGPAARGTQSVVRASQASDQTPSAGPTNAHGSDWTMKMPSVSVTGSTQNRVPQEPAQPYVPADPGIIGAGGSTLTPTPRPYPSPSET